jgi:hypothetical protein
MARLFEKYRSELWDAFDRRDGVPEDLTRCSVRFLYRCHKAGF